MDGVSVAVHTVLGCVAMVASDAEAVLGGGPRICCGQSRVLSSPDPECGLWCLFGADCASFWGSS